MENGPRPTARLVLVLLGPAPTALPAMFRVLLLLVLVTQADDSAPSGGAADPTPAGRAAGQTPAGEASDPIPPGGAADLM